MAIQASEIEIGLVRVDHGCGTAPRVVIVTGQNRATRVDHLADRTQMIAGVEVGGGAGVLALRIHAQRNSIVCIANLTLAHSTPDELLRGIDRAACLLHDLGQAIQAVVGELTPVGGSSVVEGDETICSVPLEGACQAIIDQASVQIISEGAGRCSALAQNLVHVVRRGGRCPVRYLLGSPIGCQVVAIDVLFDQRVGRSVLQWRCEQLIRVVIAKIIPLRACQARVVLSPGEELAFGLVSVIKLGDAYARALRILDLLESFVLRVRAVRVDAAGLFRCYFAVIRETRKYTMVLVITLGNGETNRTQAPSLSCIPDATTRPIRRAVNWRPLRA